MFALPPSLPHFPFSLTLASPKFHLPIKLFNFATDSVFQGIQAKISGTVVQGKILAQVVSMETKTVSIEQGEEPQDHALGPLRLKGHRWNKRREPERDNKKGPMK